MPTSTIKHLLTKLFFGVFAVLLCFSAFSTQAQTLTPPPTTHISTSSYITNEFQSVEPNTLKPNTEIIQKTYTANTEPITQYASITTAPPAKSKGFWGVVSTVVSKIESVYTKTKTFTIKATKEHYPTTAAVILGVAIATKYMLARKAKALLNTVNVIINLPRRAASWVGSLGYKFEKFLDHHIGRTNGTIGYTKGLAAGVAIFGVALVTGITAIALDPVDAAIGISSKAVEVGRYAVQCVEQPSVFIQDTKAEFNDFLTWNDTSSMYEKGKAVSQFSLNAGLAVDGAANLVSREAILATKQAAIESEEYVNLVSKGRTHHILEGESAPKGEWSGGHRFGTNKNKPEFPQNWSDEKILHEISDIATDPSLIWIKQKNGAYLIQGIRDSIPIGVVVKDNKIITGFPIVK